MNNVQSCARFPCGQGASFHFFRMVGSLFLGKLHHAANALAIMHQLKAFVDFFQRQTERHILFHTEVAVDVFLNETLVQVTNKPIRQQHTHRQVGRSLIAAKCCAAPHTPCDKLRTGQLQCTVSGT